MKVKKIVASFLTLSFMSLFTAPLSTEVSAQTDNMSLAEFLKTTDKIEASYSYPSMRISANETGKSKLSAQTPVIIASVEEISTENIKSGDVVNFKIANDVNDTNGNILIKAGTPVSAKITFVKSKLRIGRSGEITISDFNTKAVDGTYVPLSGTVSEKAHNKMTLSIVLSAVICPLFLLMRGKEAVLPA